MGKYYTQLICRNGHQLTDRLEDYSKPRDFCDMCGVSTISKCENCSQRILGDYEIEGFAVISSRKAEIPDYCSSCGEPFPWTKEVLSASKELLEFDETLSNDEKNSLADLIPELLTNNPKTKVAIFKMKKYFEAGSEIVVDSLKSLLVDVVSETVKKALFN